tara:strand:- start:303 stop:671 length:369 start_codon:yes stop_codon:yes gene_type:complete
MKGNLVSYKWKNSWGSSWADTNHEFVGIVIDYLAGYHFGNTWSDSKTFVENPMIKIYWISSPSPKPVSARLELIRDLDDDDESSNWDFVKDLNGKINEWGKINDGEWYFASRFEIKEDICCE